MTYTSLLLAQNLRILDIHLFHRDRLRIKLSQCRPLVQKGDYFTLPSHTPTVAFSERTSPDRLTVMYSDLQTRKHPRLYPKLSSAVGVR